MAVYKSVLIVFVSPSSILVRLLAVECVDASPYSSAIDLSAANEPSKCGNNSIENSMKRLQALLLLLQ